ncbi:chemotaxis protein CheB [Parahaliea maris]|uniref:chemotaxis protein CheB n=1 Tax=Parahaliea maris TaxID=2716870 RepID=UPI00164F3F19|nr:chemotaxis protein CheB [Parahaliea maris]
MSIERSLTTLREAEVCQGLTTRLEAVWLLAGSAGATVAVQRFFASFRRRPPVAFLYAQHYDPARQEQLRQLTCASDLFQMELIQQRHTLRPGAVLIVPPRCRVGFSAGDVFAEPHSGWGAGHTPDIDELAIIFAAAALPARGLILFSGMGNDGAGSLDVLDTTGCRMWVQEPASAVCRGIPEAALASGLIHRSASPELLASALEQLYE